MKSSLKTSVMINNILTAQDPVLKTIIGENQIIERELTTDYVASLLNAIIGQQLSGKVADVIWGRFVALYEGTIRPETVLATDDAALRNIGLSYAKITYVKNFAKAVTDGTVDLQNLEKMTDEDIISQLIQVKGIGRWTAEMFLIFSLGREDVFSMTDGGLLRATRWLYKLGEKPSKGELTVISDRWKPYRTYASFYLWEVANANMDKKEKKVSE